MRFDVLPGPTLPELARTALARAAAATVCDPGRAGGPTMAGQVPVRDRRDGSPLLLSAHGSLLEQRLAEYPGTVTVSVPAPPPFCALRLTGTARLMARDAATGITSYAVAPQCVEFTGAGGARVPIGEYQAAVPDPLWRLAPRVLRHLERSHMAELISCVRAHGMVQADWVIPRGLDRYGLELLVLTLDGTAAIRLSFPVGPVTSLSDAAASILGGLTCRCEEPR